MEGQGFAAARTAVSWQGRHHIAARLLAAERGRLLDVGARDRRLGRLLASSSLAYESADLAPGPHDHRVDLEAPLPFADGAYDWVVALDVLEHVDRAHAAAAEILRVARRGCVVSLPNLASWPHRLRFLRTGRLATSKHELAAEPAGDRHRWLVHLRDADRFVAAAARRQGFVVDARVLECEGRGRLGRLGAWTLLRAGNGVLPCALAARTVYRLVRCVPGEPAPSAEGEP